MILDSLNKGDTLRLTLESENSDNSLVSEGIIKQNTTDILVLKDKGIGPLLSCRVIKSETDGNYTPVKVLMKRDADNEEVLDYEMAGFRSPIEIDD